MKSIFLGSLMLLLSINAFSQVNFSDDFKYSVSKPYEVVDGTKYYFSNDKEVYAFKYGKGAFTIQRFDEDGLNEIKRNEIEKGEGFTIEDCLEFNNKYYFFFSRWDKANTTEQLFIREIDFENCKFASDEQLLIKVNGKVTGGFSVSFFVGATSGGSKFQMGTSFSKQNMIIQYRIKPEEKRDALNKDVIGMHVFSGEMDEVWAKQVEMPYTEKKMNNLDYTIDDKGNAYVLAEVYKDETTKRATKSGDPNYRLEILKIDSDDQTITKSELKLENKFIKDVGFFEGSNNQIVVAGYYGNTFKNGTDGMFYSKLNEDGEITEETFAEIPVEVMSMYMSERKQDKMEKKGEKKDLSMANMVLREIIFDEDGGVTLYGERYFVVSNYNPKTGTTTYTYYYQDILGAKLSAEGEVAWMNKFPKNQRGKRGRGGMGYYVMQTEDYDYLLYLDNVKNIELPLTQYPKTHQDGAGGFLTGFKVNSKTGETEKISILDTRDAKGITLYQFNTGRIVPLSDNSFGLECYKKKKEDVMIKVELND